MRHGRQRWAALAGMAFLVGACADPAREPAAELVPVGRVAPEEYWAAAVEAAKCLQDEGLSVIGPFPTADGAMVRLDNQVPAGGGRPECLERYDLLSRDFQLANNPVIPDGLDPRDEEIARRSAEPATPDAEALSEGATQLIACLVEGGALEEPPPRLLQDDLLHAGAADHPEDFATCVTEVRIG